MTAPSQIDGKDPFRWNNRGLIWRRKGDFDRAIADFDQAIRVDPGYTAAYTNRGQAYEGKGDKERAKADYEAALALPQKYSNGKYAHDKARSGCGPGATPRPRRCRLPRRNRKLPLFSDERGRLEHVPFRGRILYGEPVPIPVKSGTGFGRKMF